MTAPTTPAAVLAAAADYIEANGWIQGAMTDGGTRCCAVGAIAKVVTGQAQWPVEPVGSEARKLCYAAEQLAYQHLPDGQRVWDWLTYWNDAEGRTQAEVVALLREAAASTPDTQPAGLTFGDTQ